MPGMEGGDSSTEHVCTWQRVQKSGGVGNVGGDATGGISLLFCSRENDSPNKASPCNTAVAEVNVNEEDDSNQHSIVENLQLAEENLMCSNLAQSIQV